MIQNPQANQSLTVNAQGGLYLRVQPSTQVGWIAAMPFGSVVVATGNEQNGFAEVVFNGQKGWASEQYLDAMQVQQMVQQVAQVVQQGGQQLFQQQQSLPQPTQVTAGLILTITGQDVLLRKEPVINGQSPGVGNVILGTNKGEKVTTTGTLQNGFTNVSYTRPSDGQTFRGWMADQYLTANAVPPSITDVKPPPQEEQQQQQPIPQPKAESKMGWGGFAVGLGILIAAGYYLVK